jgi:hypothetical protein
MRINEIVSLETEEYMSLLESAAGYLTEEEIRVLRENPKILQEWGWVPAITAATLIAKYGKKAYYAAKRLFNKKSEIVNKNFDKTGTNAEIIPFTKSSVRKPGKLKASNDDIMDPVVKDLMTPISKSDRLYHQALKVQKVTKYKKTGDVEHLRGLAPSEVYQAGGKKALDALGKKGKKPDYLN